jgi:hypothetical protein
MKKLFAIGGLMLLSGTLIATSANAAAVTPTVGGALLTIANANTGGTAPGPNFTYTPSPGVSMSAVTAINGFALSASNGAAAAANRNEYGVWSGYSGYYQQTSVAAGTDTAEVTEDVSGYDPTGATTPFTGTWDAMGGAGAGS